MKRKIMRDERGALEGLPLQLLIMVIIAGIGIAIILGWMYSIKTPNAITSIKITDGTNIVNSIEYDEATGTVTPSSITITVYDQDNNKLGGATVILNGVDVYQYGTTDSDGTVTLDVSSAELTSDIYGHIHIVVEKTGYTAYETDLLVVKAT